MSVKPLWMAVCLALLPTLSAAEVFHWTDAQGHIHYSDQSHQNAQQLKIQPSVSYYWVERVFDGDTILLSNGEKIRFLGVNTPEVAGRNKFAEAGGDTAKAWLKQALEHKKVYLQGDVEKYDKYQRRLAYVFTEDKQFVNLELVKNGLAIVNIFPPNLQYLELLLQAQQIAEQAKIGIWQLADYQPQRYQTIDETNYKGWKRLTGRINAVKSTGKNHYLQFSNGLAIQINKAYEGLFPTLTDYVDQQVEVRGWVTRANDRFAILVRHPADIKILQK